VNVAPVLAMLEEASAAADVRPAIALVAGRDVALAPEELRPALRRALLLLAAGGDPRREPELDGRAVTALAAELDHPERRAALADGLAALVPLADRLPQVRAAVQELTRDEELAWRAYACAFLADEIG
jgi:hypothetical protein